MGKLQAQSLVEKLQAQKIAKPTIVMINGAPTDNNAGMFKKGAHSVFDPLVKEGKLTIAKEYDTPDWSPDQAQTEMQQALTALGGRVDGVYCANDGTASGAIAAMRAAAMNPLPPVTGQDAELAAVQRIVQGQQYMTVYKPIKPEAADAARMAVALLEKRTLPAGLTHGHDVNNGKVGVPSALLTPVAVTKANVRQTVVKDGFWKADQIGLTAAGNEVGGGVAGGTRERLLELRGVSKRFGAVQALSGVDFEVGPAEVVGLVGDNGAGKSTLVKVIAGVYRPDAGEYWFEGRRVEVATPRDATELGVQTVYQDLALCENLDVVANLYLGKERTRVLRGPLAILDELGMEQRSFELVQELHVRIPSLRTVVASLSGGQRQSVAVARAVMWDSKVVLLDEPTAALGVEQTQQVKDLIRGLRQRGLGVVVISHNLADVFDVTDRIVVLRLGRRVASFDTGSATRQAGGGRHHRGGVRGGRGRRLARRRSSGTATWKRGRSEAWRGGAGAPGPAGRREAAARSARWALACARGRWGRSRSSWASPSSRSSSGSPIRTSSLRST